MRISLENINKRTTYYISNRLIFFYGRKTYIIKHLIYDTPTNIL